MYRRIIKSIDYPLVIATLVLLIFGLVNIGSATLEFTDSSMEKIQSMNVLIRLLHLDYSFVVKQIGWIFIGLIVTAAIIYIDYEDMTRYSKHLYLINLAMLLAVILVGHTALGAQRWISIGPFSLQPSEFSKLIIIISFADFLARRQGKLNSIKDLIPCFIYIGIPMALVLKQPDLGTSLVFIAIMFGMLFVAGARPSILLGIIGAGVILAVSLYGVNNTLTQSDAALQKKIAVVNRALGGNYSYLKNDPDVMNDIKDRGFNTSTGDLNQYLEELKKELQPIEEKLNFFHNHILKEYQMKRLTVFMNPESDLLGAGYHVWQSRIAIGSGGLTGKGLLGGTQSHYTFLPIRHTDFIFSVVGEEYGFVGSTILLCLYFFILYRGIRITILARDNYGAILASGVVSLFAFHIILNVAMTSGIAPVTGIPLPFFSYGGSNMIMNMAALGVLLNIFIRRQKLIF